MSVRIVIRPAVADTAAGSFVVTRRKTPTLSLLALFSLGSLAAQQTTLQISSSPNPSVFGQTVTLTATVSSPPASGSVTYYDGVTLLGIGTLTNGQSHFTTTLLESGTRSLRAYYAGDSAHPAASSPVLSQVVKAVAIKQFGPPVSYTNSDANAIAISDLNGDGKDDLVVTNEFGNVSVLLGNGDGSFQNPRSFSTDDQLLSVAVADLNGDGHPDIVVASQGFPIYSGTVGVFLGNGDGTFQPRVDYPIGSGGARLVVADFNGDGKADVAVANYGDSTFSVLLGNGDGTLQRRVNYVTGEHPISIAVGDFNGDGKTDIAVGVYFGPFISVYLGNGDGTFSSPINSPLNLNYGLNSLVVEDFNGDGKLDIAASGDNLNLLYGNGDGSFRAPVLVNLPIPSSNTTISSAPSLAAGDFDGDGKPDIVVSDSYGNIFVVLSTGGFLQSPQSTAGLYSNTAVAVGDFNGDGKPDLVYNYQFSVAIRLGGVGSTSTTALTASPNPAFCDQPVTLTATISPSTATGTVTFYDGKTFLGSKPVVNGQAALTTSFSVPLPAFPNAVYSGDAYYSGSASPVVVEPINPAPTTTTLTSSPNPSSFGSKILLTAAISPPTATGTIEFRDGGTTIATQAINAGVAFLSTSVLSAGSHTLLAIYQGDNSHLAGASTLLTHTVNPAQATSTSLTASSASVTYNQSVALTAQVSPDPGSGRVTFYDGVDLLGTRPLTGGQAIFVGALPSTGNRSIRARFVGTAAYAASASPAISLIVSAQPANSFLPVTTYPAAGTSIARADFNGDGKPDFAVGGNASVSILMGNGDGTFQPAVSWPAASGNNYVAAGDWNGDGKADLAVSTLNSLAIWLGNGDGTFQPAIAYSNISGGPPLAADFNGDGIPDIAFNNGSVLLGNGDGTFQAPLHWAGRIDLVADFNNDGKLDISSSGSVLLGNDDGTFRGSVPLPPSSGGFTLQPSAAAGDFNNDGRTDLIAAFFRPFRSSQPSAYMYSPALQQPDGSFSLAPMLSTTISSGVFVTGDFNGDGNLDAAFTQFSSISVFPGRGDGTFGPARSYSATAISGTPLVGDFNGDGITDLAFISSTGVGVLLGTVIQSSTTVLTSSLNPSTYGDNVTLTAVVTPSSATGNVTFYFNNAFIGTRSLVNGQATLTTNQIGPGQYSLTAVYAGDAYTYTSTSAAVTQVVNVATPLVTLTSSANPATVGQSVVLTATLSAPLAAGTIRFQDGGQVIGSQTVNSGAARLLLHTLPVGSHPITASFISGDPYNNSNSSSVLTLTINPGVDAAVTVTSSANPATYGQPLTITATLSPADATGLVNFYDGANFLGTGRISAGQAVLTTRALSSGARSLRAWYSGDGAYHPSVSATLAQNVRPVAAVTFRPPINQTMAQLPLSLAVGDSNGDGIPDLITSDYGFVRVFQGNGDGTFQMPVVVPTSPVGNDMYVVAADLNGDGKSDLIVGYGYSSSLYTQGPPTTLSVHLSNGDGTFQPPIYYDAGSGPRSIAVADVNGDGLADIIVSDYGNGPYTTNSASNVGVLLGNGDGTFQPIARLEGFQSQYVQALIPDDLNGDGIADLAVTDGSAVTILLGNGDGTFRVALTFTPPAGVVAITSGDFNGDAHPDLAIAANDGTVTLFSGNGDGTFRPPVTWTVGIPVVMQNNFPIYVVAIAAGDFDGDGNLDLAVTNALGVAVLSGNGDGSFKDPVYYGNSSQILAVADLDGDGRTDLLYANFSTRNVPLSVSALLGTDAQAPSISAAGVVNAASPSVATVLMPSTPLVPGSLGAAYGSFLVSPQKAPGPPLPGQISGLSASFANGITAPIASVANGKITFQVPWELAGQAQAMFSVTVNGQSTAPQSVSLASYAPAIFSTNGMGTGQAMAYDMSNRLVDSSNPATAGSTIVQIYCTGLGAVSNPPATGYAAPNNLSLTAIIPTVSIGGQGAPVLFSGLLPGVVGVYQINALVPLFADGQPIQPITISNGVMTSNAPTIAVKSIAPASPAP